MRLLAVGGALLRWPFDLRRRRPADPRRILVLHHLLLGDTLMLTGLLAKLRARHSHAEIIMTVARAHVHLYDAQPYGVRAHAFDPRDVTTLRGLGGNPPFDLAILPADNRWAWLARALGTRWIVALAGDRPAHKNWPVDELVPYSPEPCAFVETAMSLVPGAAPAPYTRADWPSPPRASPAMSQPYAVLHVGASSPLKQWQADSWREVATELARRGMDVVWSCGPGEEHLVTAVQPRPGERVVAGTLTLTGMWQLIDNAALLVAPDTGIAHLGRIVGTPTVVLFGPGSALMCGPGAFFEAMPYRAVTTEPFSCRDQRIQFFREVDWVRRCERLFGGGADRCARPRCMESIAVSGVLDAVDDLTSSSEMLRTRAADHDAAVDRLASAPET
ncbi:MAG: heptosyltransferase [Pseudomonadota bacterium]|nr:heptosyltransferase [Pseudomonadota bacterium]